MRNTKFGQFEHVHRSSAWKLIRSSACIYYNHSIDNHALRRKQTQGMGLQRRQYTEVQR